ncbi:rod shape-determining protein RodA [Flavobacteriaceae bacterium]|nr:rod shape-determining protein RodA [Flavobacteriaceae bacterium]MDA9318065.1 rod shape-determining protein RodA [Flavobacteriaceae bacterium]
MSEVNIKKIDWLSVLILGILIALGLGNIFSSSQTYLLDSIFSLNPFTKQLFFVIISFFIFLFVQILPVNFFTKYSSILYVISILSLIGLFIFGNEVNGAQAWYQFNGFSIQPSEFAKPITALALAKYLSDINSNLKTIKTQFYSFLIILIPITLIILQPDPGTIIIFLGFILVFYKIGLPSIYMNLFVGFIILFFATILLTPKIIITFLLISMLISFFLSKKNKKLIKKTFIYGFIFSVFIFSVDFIFNNVFEERHRNRFNIVMGMTQDDRGTGYNSNQSRIAFASGGLTGEGFLKGSQTRGNFVPEQHTDYIFSTVGEEWGFLGASFIILLYTFLMLRISKRAELQRNLFSKIYSYSAVTIIFTHFFINIGMVIGLVPTIGIPLPFLSYGGSSLMAFVLLFSIYIKLDSQRTSKW